MKFRSKRQKQSWNDETQVEQLDCEWKIVKKFTNQVQQLDLKFLRHMEFRSKSRKQSWSDGTQVQQLECAWENVKKFTKPSPATWIEIALINGIHIEKQKQSWNYGTHVQQLECEWEIVKKFTKPSPATWFEIVLIYGIQVEKPKTELKWRNSSPATWVWIRNCQVIYQTKSSSLIWNCFDMWNSGRNTKNRVEMAEPKSINLSVNAKLSRNLSNQAQQLDLKLLLYMEFRSESQKQSWNDGTQGQQLECAWENVKKFAKPSPATWIEIALINGIHIEKQKTELKWRNPSPATWVWMRNCQETYQTKSSNLIWNCFDIWNSGRKAKNRVEVTELKSSNLSVNKKLSSNLPNQVQQLDLKLLWYVEFRSKYQKQSWNGGTQVHQLGC